MRIIATILGSLCLLALGACTNFSGKNPEQEPLKETRIGILLPMSGEQSLRGRKTLDGIFFAHDQIDRKGLVRGKMIKLVIIDNKSTVEGSRAAMKRFIAEEVSLVIAACTTANALAIKPLATKAELPVLLTVATGNIATERSPFMFRCCFTDNFQGKAMADFVYKDKMFNNIGILFDLNEQVTYRRDLARAFASEFKRISGKAVTEAGYTSGTGNVLPALEKLKMITPAAIFAPSDVTDAATILKEARQNSLSCTFLGSDGWDRPELFANCGPKPEPCYVSSMFSTESELPGVKEFVRSIKAQTGSLPTTDTAQAYDALNIVVQALRRSRSRTDIRSGLYQIQNYPGITGTTSIEADGNARKTIFIKEVIKGADGKPAFKLIKTIFP